MATVDKTVGSGSVPARGLDKCYLMSQEIDLTAIATGDVVQCLSIPAMTLVVNVFVEVITATGLTSTATVGDADGANSWDASTNLNATAGTTTYGISGTDAYALPPGKLYTAADTIDLTCTITSGPCTTGKVKVTAICVNLD